jgi:hypothetical protein
VLDLVNKSANLLITGDYRLGKKTSLAKAFFIGMHQAGNVPVLINGDGHLPRGDHLYCHLETVFIEQYEPEALPAYRQLDRGGEWLSSTTITRFHFLQIRKILLTLTKFAGRVIVFAHDMILIEKLAVGEGGSFVHFRIQQFGHLRRNRLIEKWLLLGAGADRQGPSFAHQLATATRAIDTVIGKNFVPAYPIYILSGRLRLAI